MKERIYTIPINDAFDKDCECPVCEFEREEEKKIIDYTVGASMMEPDSREITNEKGFCKNHYMKIISTPNKLSAALINETHIEKILDDLKNFNDNLCENKKTLFKKNTPATLQIQNSANHFEKLGSSCAVCDRLNATMTRFAENILFLCKTDEGFRKKFFSGKGFCIKHFALLLKLAPNEFKNNELYDFTKKLYNLEIENISRVLGDVKWFVKKFDYRFKDEDWKNSKDAVVRSTAKVVSYEENV